MTAERSYEREVRAARNQSMFRAVNEQISELNQVFADITGTFTIACECADPTCAEMLSIRPSDYDTIRRNPRQFAVLSGHVHPAVEDVVAHAGDYMVVEKIEAAAASAEWIAEVTVDPKG